MTTMVLLIATVGLQMATIATQRKTIQRCFEQQQTVLEQLKSMDRIDIAANPDRTLATVKYFRLNPDDNDVGKWVEWDSVKKILDSNENCSRR